MAFLERIKPYVHIINNKKITHHSILKGSKNIQEKQTICKPLLRIISLFNFGKKGCLSHLLCWAIDFHIMFSPSGQLIWCILHMQNNLRWFHPDLCNYIRRFQTQCNWNVWHFILFLVALNLKNENGHNLNFSLCVSNHSRCKNSY